MYFVNRWKKLTYIFLIIIIALSVFGPMREAYDNTHFQTDEDANTCNFLSMVMPENTDNIILTNQVNYGYFVNKHSYLRNFYVSVVRPGNIGFKPLFDRDIKLNNYIFYNTNLGKEILYTHYSLSQLTNKLIVIQQNNKIFNSDNTFIIKGVESE